MKKLIIIRHGMYNSSGGRLTTGGERQMEVLGATLLDKHLNGGSIRLLSSTAPRAEHSSDILGRLLKVKPEHHETLWSGNDSPAVEDPKKVLELIAEAGKEADTVVVVTHLEYVYSLPYLFGRVALGVENFPRGLGEKGDAFVIDCVNKTWVMERPEF